MALSSRGLLAFLEILSGQESLATANQDPYVRSHPLTRDRIEFLEGQVAHSAIFRPAGSRRPETGA